MDISELQELMSLLRKREELHKAFTDEVNGATKMLLCDQWENTHEKILEILNNNADYFLRLGLADCSRDLD